MCYLLGTHYTYIYIYIIIYKSVFTYIYLSDVCTIHTAIPRFRMSRSDPARHPLPGRAALPAGEAAATGAGAPGIAGGDAGPPPHYPVVIRAMVKAPYFQGVYRDYTRSSFQGY